MTRMRRPGAAGIVAGLAAGLLMAAATAVRAEPLEPGRSDPLHSVMWDVVHSTVLEDAPVVFDDAHVRLFTPPIVEDSRRVPVSVEVSGLDDVREIVVLADHNPIPSALRVLPAAGGGGHLELSIKVNEATPIRAAARTGDGVWHVGGMRVDAAGGGCAAPRPVAASNEWESALNKVQGRAWRLPGGGVRLQWRIVHPMDTGLVENIPVFHIEDLVIAAGGQTLARLQPTAATAENPTFTIDLPAAAAGAEIRITGRDTDGNEIDARIPAPDALFGLMPGRRS